MHNTDIILKRIKELRGSMFTWLCIAGLARLLCIVTALILFSLLVDWFFHMDQIQRLISLLIGLGVAGWAAYRYIFKPIRTQITDDALIQQVEKTHPETKNALIAAFQFSRLKTPEGTSEILLNSAIDQGNAAAANLDFRGVLDWGLFKRYAIVGVAALSIPVIAAVITPQSMSIWLDRNILLGQSEWPQRTRLTVKGLKDQTLPVAQFGKLDIVAVASGVIPDEVVLEYKDATGNTFDEQMPLLTETSQKESSEFRTTFNNVTETFEFRVSGGDARTPWYRVVLLPRPEVKVLSAALMPPKYVGEDKIDLGSDKSNYDVLAGSSLALTGEASVPLSLVELSNDQGPLVSAACSGNSFSITLPKEKVVNGSLYVSLVSADEVRSLRPHTLGIRVVQDQPPHLTAKLDGIGQLVLTKAKVPLVCIFQDDYGVDTAQIAYRCQPQDGEVINGSVLFDLKSIKDRKSFEGRQKLELAKLLLPVDTSLTVSVDAKDKNDGESSSTNFTLRIVTEDDLRADFQRREQLLRAVLKSALKKQRLLLDESRLFKSAPADQINDKVKARQLRADKAQRKLLARVHRVVSGVGQIVREIDNNGLEGEDGELRVRLVRDVSEPLSKLEKERIPQIADMLSTARVTAPSKQAPIWAQAVVQQRTAIKEMKAILEKMTESMRMQQLQQMLKKVLEEQKKINRDTEKKEKKNIEDIFD